MPTPGISSGRSASPPRRLIRPVSPAGPLAHGGRLLRMELRLADRRDAEAIREIYNREVLESTATFDLVPRSLEDQQAWLAARSGARAAIVAVGADGEVVGFGSLSPWRDRPAYATTVEDSVYVHRGHQGRGVGRALLAQLVEVATAHGFHAVHGPHRRWP